MTFAIGAAVAISSFSLTIKSGSRRTLMKDPVVLITGALTGIGRATALTFALFNGSTGVPPHRFVLRQRMASARRVLAAPELVRDGLGVTPEAYPAPERGRACRGARLGALLGHEGSGQDVHSGVVQRGGKPGHHGEQYPTRSDRHGNLKAFSRMDGASIP